MPREDLLRLLRSHITNALLKHYTDSSYNIFDGLVQLLQTNWDTSPTTIAQIRQTKNTKSKGDLFEHFALLYFKHCYCFAGGPTPANVWLLADVPQQVLNHLGLKRNDLGIDLILEHVGAGPAPNLPQYSAIQVKYRKRPRYKTRWGVSWKDLSTFYALVNRTGPYRKHIVFTNSHWARHVGGRKTKTDQSICIGTLQKIETDKWRAMAALQGHSLKDGEEQDREEQDRDEQGREVRDREQNWEEQDREDQDRDLPEPEPEAEVKAEANPNPHLVTSSIPSKPRLVLPRLRVPVVTPKVRMIPIITPEKPAQPKKPTKPKRQTQLDPDELRRRRLAYFGNK